MCSGRVDLGFILKAFANGIDGVFVGGCRLGECNYITHGNFYALNTVLLAKRILERAGLNPDRVTVEFMSGAEANVFVDVVNGFVSRIKKLGPLGQSEAMDYNMVRAQITEISKLVPYIKIVAKEKLARRLDSPEEYDSLFTRDDIDRLFSEVVSYYIDPSKCRACSTCLKRCPAEAISGGKNLVHVIDQEKCIKCGTCLEVCPPRFGAVTKISGEPVPPPIPEEERVIAKKSKA